MAVKIPESTDIDSLDQVETVVEDLDSEPAVQNDTPAPASFLRRQSPLKLAIICLLILLLCGLSFVILKYRKTATTITKTVTINTQSLDSGTLHTLTNQLDKSGSVKQQLTISPNTLFNNDVTVQGSTSLLGPVSIGDNLSVGGGLTVGRNASIGGGLSVSGAITAGTLNVGSINVSTLTLSGNFNWAGHLISTGTATTATVGLAIGNGRVTVTGNDSIGSVAIVSGTSGLLANGEVAIVHFHTPYSGTPIVQITPADQGAAALQYYVVAAPDFFSIRTVSAPGASVNYVFNYFVSQ
jgi:hypothetical protein